MSAHSEVRKARERHAVATRKAVQMARFWIDQGSPATAKAWAESAVKGAEAFAAEIAEEARLLDKTA